MKTALGLGILFTMHMMQSSVYYVDASSSSTAPDSNASSNPFSSHVDLESLNLKNAQTIEYKAQTGRLMRLIVNSVYKNKEVFFREILANACDAIDKLRRKKAEQGDASGLAAVSSEARIDIKIDKEAQTLTIRDNGIGMSRGELQDYLGIIAKSGTAEVLSKLKDSKDASTLFGQFGMGFYSVFLVGKEVAVSSKSEEDITQWVWVGEVDSPGFVILEDPRGNTLGSHGTEVTIKLKPDSLEYLDGKHSLELVQQFASFYPYPIHFELEKEVEKEVPAEEEKDTKKDKAEEDGEKPKDDENAEKPNENDDEVKVESDDEEKKDANKTKVIKELVKEDIYVNDQPPIWLQDPSKVERKEYDRFYQVLFKTKETPFAVKHFSAEGGETDFSAILFIPRTPPFDVWSMKETKSEVHLYVRRAFVTNLDDAFPTPLAFVRGFVDSSYLPLNLSRETLQHTSALKVIRARITSKAIELIKDILEGDNANDANKMWNDYAGNLKLEIYNEEKFRAKLAPLLRFLTNRTHNAGGASGTLVTLDQYVKECAANQKAIYYLAGENADALAKSPFMERLNERNLQVIFATAAIDESVFQALGKYADMPFQSIAKDGFKLPEDESQSQEVKAKAQEQQEAHKKAYAPLVDWLKKTLAKDVERVVLSDKLSKSAFAVVAQQFGLTGHMEKLYLSQQQGGKMDPMLAFLASQKKILEINPDHETIKVLLKAVQEHTSTGENDGKDAVNEEKLDALKPVIQAMYDTALLSSGFLVKNPQRLTQAIEQLAYQMLGEKYNRPPTNPKDDEETNPFDAFLRSQQFGDAPLNNNHDKDDEELDADAEEDASTVNKQEETKTEQEKEEPAPKESGEVPKPDEETEAPKAKEDL